MIIDDNDDDEETMKEMCEIVQFLESQEEYMNAAVTDVLTSGAL
jgi:exonuclease VII small subunit